MGIIIRGFLLIAVLAKAIEKELAEMSKTTDRGKRRSLQKNIFSKIKMAVKTICGILKKALASK